MPREFDPLWYYIENETTVRKCLGRPNPADHGRLILPKLMRWVLDPRRGIKPYSPTGLSIVEVGSWAGASALEIVEGTEHGTVYCVDNWEGSHNDATGMIVNGLGAERVYSTFLENVREHLYRRIIPCVGTSKSWANRWPFQVAAVYIDAAHEYADAISDMRLWWPLVADGGLMIGHDYKSFPGVKKATDDFVNRSGVDLVDFGYDDEVWWMGKNCRVDLGELQ